MPQLATITSRGQLTIPARIRKQTGLQKNRKVLVNTEEDSIRVTPLTNRGVLSVYQAVDPGNQPADPEKAIQKMRAIRARKVNSHPSYE